MVIVKKTHLHPNTRDLWTLSFLEKEGWQMNSVKDLEMRRSSWMSEWAFNPVASTLVRERQRESWDGQKGRRQREEEEASDHGGRDCRDVATSLGGPPATRNGKRQKRALPQNPVGMRSPDTSIVDIWPPSPRQSLIYCPTLWICLFWIFHTNGTRQYVVFCVWLPKLSMVAPPFIF